MALRTVMRETPKSPARSRSGGSASSAPRMLPSIASRSARCSCWYSGRLLDPASGPTVCESRRQARVFSGAAACESSDTNAIPQPPASGPSVAHKQRLYSDNAAVWVSCRQACHSVTSGIILASKWFCHGLSGNAARKRQRNHSPARIGRAGLSLRGTRAHEQNTIDLDRNRSRHRPVRTERSARAAGSSSRKSSSPASATRTSCRSKPSARRTRVVEVITAEDIGKMPDKNVADSLARVPGVTISSASANEGGFDENDRVSMRGTNPSLTQTLINGHNVAPGDWFVLNQVRHGRPQRQLHAAAVGARRPGRRAQELARPRWSKAASPARSTSSRASRSTSTTSFTFGGSVGAVYAELPDKTDPQISACSSTGRTTPAPSACMCRRSREERHLRRDGEELLGYAADRARTAPSRVAIPTWPACTIPTPDRRGALRAGAQAHRRPDRRRSSSRPTT